VIKLYTYFQSSASYRVRIALNLKNIPAEMIYVNLVKGEHRTVDYAAINPEMIVPTFIDDGKILSQSLAILEYLEETHPVPALLPSEPFARAYVRGLSYTISSDTAPITNLKVRKYIAGTLKQPENAVAEWMRYWMDVGLASFEKVLARSSHKGKFCYGDTPTMADCCLIPQIYNAHRWKCDISPYPLISGIAKECETHPAFIAAHPSKQKDAA